MVMRLEKETQMNLFTKYEAGLPLSEFLAEYGSDAHRTRWKLAHDQTSITDEQRKLLGTFTRNERAGARRGVVRRLLFAMPHL